VSFNNLQLIEPVLQALTKEGYTQPTPIQEQAIPVILQQKDLLGCAQTGTGKTAAFAIPLLQLMHQHQQQSPQGRRNIKALILTPTRELAIQIEESFRAYGKYVDLKTLVIFGGVSQVNQVNTLRRGVDVLVATPGRLLDLMNQNHISLRDIKFFVLDEADRMLDMGFVHDVKRIIAKLPAKRQTLFFSATMPPEIQQLANVLLTNPVKVAVTPVSSTVEIIQQAMYFVDKQNKQSLLKHLLESSSIKSALIFTRTKHGADKVAKDLSRSGIRAEAIHGNKSQNARQMALSNFKNRRTRVLVATDIAARGIDIDELTHVINFDGKWTLIHIWNTGCDPSEVAALNEISKPNPASLDVIGIAMNDTSDSIKQFSTREPIEFVNLLGGDYDGDFARKFNYFALRTDILVNPVGRIVFVGNGPSALRAAWAIFRANTSKETTLQINH